MYALGHGVAEDDEEAVRWFRKAAAQELAMAQYSMGLVYANGGGVRKDAEEAARWFRKAAEQGYAQAQHRLGVQHEDAEEDRRFFRTLMTAKEISEAEDLSAQLVD